MLAATAGNDAATARRVHWHASDSSCERFVCAKCAAMRSLGTRAAAADAQRQQHWPAPASKAGQHCIVPAARLQSGCQTPQLLMYFGCFLGGWSPKFSSRGSALHPAGAPAPDPEPKSATHVVTIIPVAVTPESPPQARSAGPCLRPRPARPSQSCRRSSRRHRWCLSNSTSDGGGQ